MLQEPKLDANASWKQRYRAASTWTQLAKAAPEHGLATNNSSGVAQLYAWEVPTGTLRQLTDRASGVASGVISPDGRYVYFMDDQGGDEIGHYVRVPFSGGPAVNVTPSLPPYSSWRFALSRASNMVGLTIAACGGFQSYVIEAAADESFGEPRLIYRSEQLLIGPALSYSGELAVLATTERLGGLNFSLLAFDLASGSQIAELSDGVGTSVHASMFSPVPGDLRLLAMSDQTGAARPLLWNPRTDERTELALDGLVGEVLPQDWSADGKRILLCQFRAATQQLYIYHLTDGTLQRLAHPSGTLSGAYFGPGEEIFVHMQDSVQPMQLIALDGETGAQRRVVLSAGPVPPGQRWRSISFGSRDGTSIQGWLGIPPGSGPFPAILELHGGPDDVMTEVFSAGAQAWIDHGYAFCSINYRGSTTFGRDFEQQIWGNLGHLEVEDMVAARDWLVAEGIAYPRQILLTGWSYGGYLTLQALGKQPELWAGGMAGIAVADWALQYADSSDMLKGYLAGLFGGTPEQKPEQYAVSSPLTYVEHVQAPVLVMQGRNDTRCPPRPMRLYEERMKELGKHIEVHWFEAGHGSYVVDQAVTHQELMLEFAYRVLQGRG